MMDEWMAGRMDRWMGGCPVGWLDGYDDDDDDVNSLASVRWPQLVGLIEDIESRPTN